MLNIARNFLIMLNNFPQIKTTSERVIQKPAKATCDLIGNKIAKGNREQFKNSYKRT